MPLHPFIETMLEQMKDRPALSDGTVEETRAMIRAGLEALGEGPEMAGVEDTTIPTRAGSIAVRLLRPSPSPAGLVLYLHGGGWVIGSVEEFEPLGRTLAAASGCTVAMVEYRLAPENPFPAPLEDAEDAVVWAAERAQAEDLPFVVAGDSAGGNLATVALLRLGGRVQPALQVLIYPVTDVDASRPSYARYGEGLPLSRKDMAWFFQHYAPGEAIEGPDVAPLRAADLSGLPPTVISLAEYDILHDEGVAYADALRAAGVPVVVRVMEGVTHGGIRLHNLCEPAGAEVAALGADIAQACREAQAA